MTTRNSTDTKKDHDSCIVTWWQQILWRQSRTSRSECDDTVRWYGKYRTWHRERVGRYPESVPDMAQAVPDMAYGGGRVGGYLEDVQAFVVLAELQEAEHACDTDHAHYRLVASYTASVPASAYVAYHSLIAPYNTSASSSVPVVAYVIHGPPVQQAESVVRHVSTSYTTSIQPSVPACHTDHAYHSRVAPYTASVPGGWQTVHSVSTDVA
eukprot:3169449-Rhodomonas_salina.2